MEIKKDGKLVVCSRGYKCKETVACPCVIPHKYSDLCHKTHAPTDNVLKDMCELHACIEVESAPEPKAEDEVVQVQHDTPEEKASGLAYKVLQEWTALDLELSVNNCIGQGWYPQGGVSVVRSQVKANQVSGESLVAYTQAMVKEI